MRIYIIAPCRKEDIWRKRRATFTLPPMALAILASLTPPEIEIKITDELVEDVDLTASPDLVALSVNTTNSLRAYELARHFRAQGAKIVMGGIHPSVMPEEALEHADSVVVGEAEAVWPELIADFQKGRLKEVYTSSKQPEMDMVPKPAWHLLRQQRYFVRRTFQVSRGCPYGCSFCSSTRFFGRKYRFKPIERVVDEIKNYEKSFIVFVDDNIIGSREYAYELFKALKPLRIRWVAQASIDIARDEPLLRLAAESGCAGLLIGFESIRYGNRKDVKKLKTPQEYEERIRLMRSYGIGVHGSFVFGFDEDTKDVFEDTVRFVLKNRLEVANYCKLTPFPGTDLFDRMKQEGRLTTMDWSKYDRYHVVYQPKNLEIKEFYRLTEEAYTKTYSPLSIIKRTPGVLKNIPYFYAINFSYMIGARLRAKRDRAIY